MIPGSFQVFHLCWGSCKEGVCHSRAAQPENTTAGLRLSRCPLRAPQQSTQELDQAGLAPIALKPRCVGCADLGSPRNLFPRQTWKRTGWLQQHSGFLKKREIATSQSGGRCAIPGIPDQSRKGFLRSVKSRGCFGMMDKEFVPGPSSPGEA